MSRLLAYVSYAVGSCVFLVVALSRGSTLLAAGSALFLLGTVLLLVPEARRRSAAHSVDDVPRRVSGPARPTRSPSR